MCKLHIGLSFASNEAVNKILYCIVLVLPSANLMGMVPIELIILFEENY